MNKVIDILNSKEDYFNTLIKIQSIIYDDNNFDDVISYVQESNLTSKREYFLHFLLTIKKCIFIRPIKINFILSIITFFKESIQREFPQFNWENSHIPSIFIEELKKIGIIQAESKPINNFEYSNLIEAIKKDDITSFQDILAKTNINSSIELNIPSYKLDKIHNPSLFELSAFFSSIKIFKFLLMNNVTKSKYLAHYAVAGGNYEIIHICEREKVSFQDINVISTAIRFFRNDIVDYLDPNPVDAIKYGALYMNVEIFIFYLRKMMSKQTFPFDPEYSNIFFRVLKHEYFEILKILCILNPECVNQADSSYQYMIHYAISMNSYEFVKFLCDLEQSDLNVTNGQLETPLFLAVREKNVEMVDLLCSYEKVDLNAQNFTENTALHIALSEASIQIINIFVKYKSRLNTTMKNNKQLTYMHIAIMTKKLEIVRLINDLNKNLRLIGNKTKSSPLIYSISYGTPAIVEYLCSFENVDVNLKNIHGIAALHLAVENPQILLILCRNKNIDLNIRNDQGNAPLHLAASKGKIESVRILLQFEDVDVNALNDYGNCPLFLASENGFLDIVKMLCGNKLVDKDIKNKSGVDCLLFC